MKRRAWLARVAAAAFVSQRGLARAADASETAAARDGKAAPASAATSSAAIELRAALDAWQADNARPGHRADPAEGLRRLAAFDAAQLPPAAALDLQVVRAALDCDRRLQVQTMQPSQHYALQLERQYGAPFSPSHAHAVLESECRALGASADRLLRSLGVRLGTTGDRFLALADDPRWRYANDDAGRDRAVADMTHWLDRARGHVPLSYPAVPSWCLDVHVRRLSAAEEAAGRPGFRAVPTIIAAGAYVVDLREIERRPAWTLPSVVHHELLPGHLLQLPLEAASGAHSLRVQALGPFTEAWATYAEEQAATDGAFADRPELQLGLLHWLLFRALRGLADTGIHHAGWTRVQALQRLRDVQGLPAYFARFDDDVDRIQREPGVRAAEALQWLGLRELRMRAARGIGVRRFHGLALLDGRMTIPLLATRLKRAGRA